MENKKHFLLFFLCIFLYLHGGQAKTPDTSWSLQQLNDFLHQATNDSTVTVCDSLLRHKLQQFFAAHPEHFSAVVDSLSAVGSVYADDHKLRILSWNYPLSEGRFGYSALFLYRMAKNRLQTEVWHCSQAFKPEELPAYNATHWYGSLYYGAYKYKKCYLLLGYSTYNDFTKVKVVDVFTPNASGFCLGSRIFRVKEDSKWVQQRVVFEYSANVQMHLAYEPAHKRFVFDHLSPEEPGLTDLYQYYGPDFTFDALVVKKKRWTLQEDLNLTNPY